MTIKYVNHRQVVTFADSEVVEVVGGRNLDGTRPLFRIRIRVSDNRNLAAHQRQYTVLANKMGVPRVIGMHGHCRIA